jgi:hypothetical protein
MEKEILELTLLDRQRLVRMAKEFPGPTRKLVQEVLGAGLGI